MKGENYGKWLKVKSEVEHFNDFDDDVKKTIYRVERDFNVILDKIICEKKEIIFTNTANAKEFENIQDEFDYEYDEGESKEITGDEEIPEGVNLVGKYSYKLNSGGYKIVLKDQHLIFGGNNQINLSKFGPI